MTAETPIAPLDAYATAKPDEPTFTLQGGDPLAEPLVKLWAIAARVQAGIVNAVFLTDFAFDLGAAAERNSVADDERERDALLIRATAAEEVSWKMKDYRAGRTDAEAEPKAAGENSLDEKARLDLFDRRVRYAQKTSEMFSVLSDIHIDLCNRGFIHEGDELDNLIIGAVGTLRAINAAIEPRRLFKST